MSSFCDGTNQRAHSGEKDLSNLRSLPTWLDSSRVGDSHCYRLATRLGWFRRFLSTPAWSAFPPMDFGDQILLGTKTHLAILQLEYQLHFLSIHKLFLDLGCNPSLCRVRLPGPCSNLVDMRHSDPCLTFGARGVIELRCSGGVRRFNVCSSGRRVGNRSFKGVKTRRVNQS